MFRSYNCHLETVNLLQEPFPFPNDHFALITFSEVLEHLPTDRVNFVLSEIARTIQPGGVLIASSPNQASLENRLRLLKGKSILDMPNEIAKGIFGHIRLYTPVEIQSAMSKRGFTLERCEMESNNSGYRGNSDRSWVRRVHRNVRIPRGQTGDTRQPRRHLAHGLSQNRRQLHRRKDPLEPPESFVSSRWAMRLSPRSGRLSLIYALLDNQAPVLCSRQFRPSRIDAEPLMPDSSDHEVTLLLQAWSAGDEQALDKLAPLVYQELHRTAHRYMARENAGHTLQTTALVNEVYLRLVNVQKVDWQGRAHFYAICARMMRRVLTDFARSRRYLKRGGDAVHLPFEEALFPGPEDHPDIVGLDEALNILASMDQRKTQVVELRFFGGFSVEETAKVLDVSVETVYRDWKLAKVWLMRELSKENRHGT